MPQLQLLFSVFGSCCLAEYGKIVKAESTSTMVIEEFYWCKDIPDQKLKYSIKLKDFNPGLQLLDMNMTLPRSLGNDIYGIVALESNPQLTVNSPWIHLTEIKEDGCKLFDKYLGQIWYDIQNELGIMPHSCPIPRGSYHAVNFRADFQNLKLQYVLPFGKLRIKTKFVDKISKEVLSCFIYIVSNKPRT